MFFERWADMSAVFLIALLYSNTNNVSIFFLFGAKDRFCQKGVEI